MIATNAAASGSPLKIGENTVEVYATDSLNRTSNTITYTITVKDYKDLLLASTSEDPMTVKITDSFQLNSQATYSNGDKITTIGAVTGHVKIDDGQFTATSFNGGNAVGDVTTLFLKFSAGKLSVGQHTIYLYINDGIRDSNIVEYHINIISKNLILSANSSDQNQTIYDNDNVKLNGSYNYDDKTDFINKTTNIKYQISNADGTKQEIVSKDIIPTTSNTANFTITLKPIGSQLFDNNLNESVNDYLKTATGLRVGRNEISVTAYDGDDAVSNTETYVINVPDIMPNINTNQQQLTTILKMNINLPMTFTYPEYSGNQYSLENKNLALFTNSKNSTDEPTKTVVDQPKETDGKVSTPYQLKTSSNWVENLSIGQNTLSVYIMDKYLRQSNTIDYQLEVLPQGTIIEVGNYKFKTIDPKNNIDDYIKRDGNWNINVISYQDKWDLHAKSNNMLHKDNSGNYTELSNLELVNFSANNTSPTSLEKDPIIASGDSRTSISPVSYSIFDTENDDNSGIMLKTDGIPIQGEYRSLVTWSIDDSI